MEIYKQSHRMTKNLTIILRVLLIQVLRQRDSKHLIKSIFAASR